MAVCGVSDPGRRQYAPESGTYRSARKAVAKSTPRSCRPCSSGDSRCSWPHIQDRAHRSQRAPVPSRLRALCSGHPRRAPCRRTATESPGRRVAVTGDAEFEAVAEPDDATWRRGCPRRKSFVSAAVRSPRPHRTCSGCARREPAAEHAVIAAPRASGVTCLLRLKARPASPQPQPRLACCRKTWDRSLRRLRWVGDEVVAYSGGAARVTGLDEMRPGCRDIDVTSKQADERTGETREISRGSVERGG
jgi:hypothetical protein